MTSNNTAENSAREKQKGFLRAHPKTRKLLLWGGVLALVIGAILVALPLVATHYLETWLRDNGAENAAVEDLDINLFTGVVALYGLEASGGPSERLTLDAAEINLRWWPLTQRRVYVQSVRLGDGQIDIAADGDAGLRIGGITLPSAPETEEPPPAEDSKPWDFGSEQVRLANLELTYRDDLLNTEIEIRELRVGSQFTWEAGRTTELELDMLIDGSPLSFRSDVQPWADDPSLSGELRLDALNLADYRGALQQLAGLEDPRGNVTLKLDIGFEAAGESALALRVAGPVEVTDAGFTLGSDRISNRSLKWDGEVSLRLPATETQPLLEVKGDLELSGARAELGEARLNADLGSFAWRGQVGLTPAADEATDPQIDVTAQLSAGGLRLAHPDLAFDLAMLESLQITGVRVGGLEDVRVERVRLVGIESLAAAQADDGEGTDRQPDVFRLAELTVDDIGLDSEAGLSAARVTAQNPAVALQRDEQGEFLRIAQLMKTFSGEAPVEDESTESAETAESEIEQEDTPVVDGPVNPPLRFAVAEVQVQAESLLTFVDRSVSPPATLKLSTLNLSVKDIDSSGSRPMTLDLVTGDGNLQLMTSGTANVFGDAVAADLEVILNGLDLPPISPYVPGYNIERGRFSTESRVKVSGDSLDVVNNLVLEKLTLSGKAGEDLGPLADGMAMPLDVALDLLRDGDGRIVLELPISGSLSDPQFGTGDIIKTAMQNALQKAAFSYVKNALQPLGTLLMVGNLASKAARPRFEPVSMAPGQAVLSGDARAYLEKISQMLAERPGLQLTICSVATPADREALLQQALSSSEAQPPQSGAAEPASEEEAAEPKQPAAPTITDAELLQLAGARTTAVTGHLAEAHHVARDRLFACRDTIDDATEEGPRTEISL